MRVIIWIIVALSVLGMRAGDKRSRATARGAGLVGGHPCEPDPARRPSDGGPAAWRHLPRSGHSGRAGQDLSRARLPRARQPDLPFAAAGVRVLPQSFEAGDARHSLPKHWLEP